MTVSQVFVDVGVKERSSILSRTYGNCFGGNLVTSYLIFNETGIVVISGSIVRDVSPSVSLIGSNGTNEKPPLKVESNPVRLSCDKIGM